MKMSSEVICYNAVGNLNSCLYLAYIGMAHWEQSGNGVWKTSYDLSSFYPFLFCIYIIIIRYVATSTKSRSVWRLVEQ